MVVVSSAFLLRVVLVVDQHHVCFWFFSDGHDVVCEHDCCYSWCGGAMCVVFMCE